MRSHTKWLRMFRNSWKRMRRRRMLVIFGVLIVIFWLFNQREQTVTIRAYCEPIDVVYTWVNGSDPTFVETIRRYNPSYDGARYDDKNELRYSLRSLEKYAPWVRHIYIVTNGQIPFWLDLSNEKVTIVPHEVLAPKLELLPTFSSAAIETFIHRIPQLSQRFLYLNDDIFLGAPLYPEDLYTESEGVRIYQAWMVPDCAEDCPWTYIGDGACDQHCNIAKCQYDGGDCSTKEGIGKSEESRMFEHDVDEHIKNVEVRHFPLRKKFRNSKYSAKRNGSHFREMVRHKNLSTLEELRRIVDNYNNQIKSHINTNSHQPLPSTTPNTGHHIAIKNAVDTTVNISLRIKNETSKDIYSHSLIHTNMLLNSHYGFKARNVLAHVGFLLDRNIINAMHIKFAKEIDITLSNRFRSTNDLQFAFGYYSFLMSETTVLTVGQVFDEFDTDNSHTWSDREVRTFLSRMYPLPLDWSAVRFFEEVIGNCSRDLPMILPKADAVQYTTLVYERYEDSNVPTITRELVESCHLLAEALQTNFAVRAKYKYNINPKRAIHNNFMMLTSNVSDVVDGFDKIRRNPRKFNCINDNLEPDHEDDNELIRHLLEDFYLSLFPRRSNFELKYEYRNRFNTWHDYQRWRRRKRAALVVGYLASAILILFIIRFACIHKAKIVRRCVQNL